MKYIIFIIIFISSCSIAPQDEVLYLKTENSYLPIYIRGNPNATTYIIWVHGGPGSSGLYYGDMEEVAQLHKNYRVVYWDQLGSGASIGNPSPDDYTISNFASHVQGIVNIIKKNYKPKNTFLLGHSWGGFLGAYYLVSPDIPSLSTTRQAQFDGFIALNGVFDIQDTITNGIDFVTNYAYEAIKNNQDKKEWKKIIKWYKQKNGVYHGADVTQHYNNVDKAGGMVIQKKRRDELLAKLTSKMIFHSPFEYYSYYDNQKKIRTYLNIENCSLVHQNKPNISRINIPTLILTGELDKIAFYKDTKRWHNILIQNKKKPADYPLILYKNAAHAIFLDSKDKYIKDIDNFINKYI